MSNFHGSSSGLTHREYVDKWLALAIAATTVIGYVSGVCWERTWGPRLLLRREIALKDEIDRLEREAEAVWTTSELYEHSRLVRSSVVLRQELLRERRKRYRYQISMETMFSPLSTQHSVRRGFSELGGQVDRQGACLCPAADAAAEVARSAPNSLGQSPVAKEASLQEVEVVPSSQLRLATQCARELIRYNLLAVVKYLLQFGHLFVFLYVFGRRPGLVVVPPSIEDSTHLYVTEVVMPYLLGIALYGPAILFAPGQAVRRNVSTEDVFTNISLARLGSDSHGSCVAAGEWSQRDLDGESATILLVKRFNAIRLCASNDLIWWFFCCLCATYLVVRVFASVG